MDARALALVRFLRLLPRPSVPSPRYLAGLRRELPGPVMRLVTGPPARGVHVSDRIVPGPAGELRVRVYRPQRPAAGRLPLVVNFHGGGFVLGSLGASDWLCGHVCVRAGVVVASVAYRLAPEHPAPAAFCDAWAATRWLVGHAGDLGADAQQVYVLGESAGGTLAALVALAARDRSRVEPGLARARRTAARLPGDRPHPVVGLGRRAGRRTDAHPPLARLVRRPVPAAGARDEHRLRRRPGQPAVRRRPHRPRAGIGDRGRPGSAARRRVALRRRAPRRRACRCVRWSIPTRSTGSWQFLASNPTPAARSTRSWPSSSPTPRHYRPVRGRSDCRAGVRSGAEWRG